MGARRTWRHRALATKGVAVVLIVALVAGCGGTSSTSSGSAVEEDVALAEVSGDVSGEVTVVGRSGVTAAVAVEGVEAITPVLEVATDGAVTGDVEIRVPVSQVPSGDHIVFALTGGSRLQGRDHDGVRARRLPDGHRSRRRHPQRHGPRRRPSRSPATHHLRLKHGGAHESARRRWAISASEV